MPERSSLSPPEGETATQDQPTTAGNLTASPGAASPEAASLVGRHVHELVVSRHPWVSASPVTSADPVHLPVAVDVQRDGCYRLPASPLSQELSPPQMPFQHRGVESLRFRPNAHATRVPSCEAVTRRSSVLSTVTRII